MKLDDVTKLGDETIPLGTAAGDKDLARDMQDRLALAGLLDPPSDGKFGMVSNWALSEFAKAKKLPFTGALNAPIAQALLAPDIEALFPINPGADFAGRIVKGLQKRRDWICRHPACFNIVYVEGANTNGTPNDNAPNQFNDVRILVQIGDGGACTPS